MRRLSVAAFAVLLLATAAPALSLILLSEAELVGASERVVVVTVTTARAEWADPDGDGVQSIYTVATLQVDDVVKGDVRPGDVLTLRIFGGTVGAERHSAPGVPTFTANDRLVLCLLPNADTREISPIVGACQGRWIVTDDAQGLPVATRSFDGSTFWRRDPSGRLIEVPTPQPATEPLADVLARLRAEVR